MPSHKALFGSCTFCSGAHFLTPQVRLRPLCGPCCLDPVWYSEMLGGGGNLKPPPTGMDIHTLFFLGGGLCLNSAPAFSKIHLMKIPEGSLDLDSGFFPKAKVLFELWGVYWYHSAFLKMHFVRPSVSSAPSPLPRSISYHLLLLFSWHQKTVFNETILNYKYIVQTSVLRCCPSAQTTSVSAQSVFGRRLSRAGVHTVCGVRVCARRACNH